MGCIGRLALLTLLLASCATNLPSEREHSGVPPENTGEPPRVSEVPSPAPRHPRTFPESLAPSALPLDDWAFGWVSDPETSSRLDLSDRFWSDQKSRWKEALDPKTPPARAAQRLEQIQAASKTDEESLRSVWRLAGTYSAALLREQARFWYDRAARLSPSPLISLERSWDQLFRLRDPAGARALWPSGAVFGDPDALRKARLLRQRLFLGTLSLGTVGADDFLSTQTLDRDDLWAATWNGAVARWSLTTGQLDLVLPAGSVAPVKLVKATGWFLYAFQDQSLLRYSKVTGTWRSFAYPPGWTGLRIQGAVAEAEDSLLVATLGHGLWRWQRGEWTAVDEGGGGPFLNAIAADGDGFWIGTKDRGLWRWQDGNWSQVRVSGGPDPVNISLIEPGPGAWFVGTWGEGCWVLENGILKPWSDLPEYVTAAVWTDEGPLWAALDVGLVTGRGAGRTVLGALDGVPGSISTLVNWEGRWIWGTTGQGWGWWSEHENPAVFR